MVNNITTEIELHVYRELTLAYINTQFITCRLPCEMEITSKGCVLLDGLAC